MRRFNASPTRRGFTMTELLVVLLILSILLALVVGISRHLMREAARKETITTQNIVLDAINRYHELTGAYPTGDSDNCGSLMNTLSGQAEAKDLLTKLPEETRKGGSNALKDGYGEDMRYRATGGYGGHPLIWSKGGDRKWDTEDDIMSDGGQ